MPGVTLNSPLNVNSSGGANVDGGESQVGALDNITGQVKGLTNDFSNKLTDPGFTQKSEMASMLKLQRAIGLETMMYQALSNVIKDRTDASKGAVANFK
jgi:hypothetical protein